MERNSSAPARAPQRRSPAAVIWLAAIVCAAAILLATPPSWHRRDGDSYRCGSGPGTAPELQL